MTQETIEHIRGIVAQKGADAWWELEVGPCFDTHGHFRLTIRAGGRPTPRSAATDGEPVRKGSL